MYQKGAYYSGIKFFNNLTLETKNVARNLKVKNNFEIVSIHLFILHDGRMPLPIVNYLLYHKIFIVVIY